LIDHLVTREELEKFAAALDRAVAARTHGDHRPLAEKSPY
jgi:hypothetical protein